MESVFGKSVAAGSPAAEEVGANLVFGKTAVAVAVELLERGWGDGKFGCGDFTVSVGIQGGQYRIEPHEAHRLATLSRPSEFPTAIATAGSRRAGLGGLANLVRGQDTVFVGVGAGEQTLHAVGNLCEVQLAIAVPVERHECVHHVIGAGR